MAEGEPRPENVARCVLDLVAAHVERCRWWLYSAPGEDTLIVEQWGADYRVLRGKKVSEATIDLMPGS